MVLGDDAEVREPMQGITVVAPGSRCAHLLSFLPKRPDCPGDIFIKMQVAMLFLKFYWKETIVAVMRISFIKVYTVSSVSSGIWVLVHCLRAFEDEAVCLYHMASYPVYQLLSFGCCHSCGGPQVVGSSLALACHCNWGRGLKSLDKRSFLTLNVHFVCSSLQTGGQK